MLVLFFKLFATLQTPQGLCPHPHGQADTPGTLSLSQSTDRHHRDSILIPKNRQTPQGLYPREQTDTAGTLSLSQRTATHPKDSVLIPEDRETPKGLNAENRQTPQELYPYPLGQTDTLMTMSLSQRTDRHPKDSVLILEDRKTP